MIIEQSSTTIDNTSLTSSTFNIEESPILFWVMSNALYQHKERAVLRELSANAWDSHKEANCLDVPISIQLPTELEPTLVITDYGIGMSKNDLETYYFSYFSSSKRSTDELIGGFGIGCKTPFIFSETYSVTTTKDGITTVALAVLSNGIPKAMYLSSEVTNAPNGTSISIPVSTKEVQTNLLTEVKTLFNTWAVKPLITIGSMHKLDLPIIQEDLIEDFVRIPKYSHSYYSANNFVFDSVSIGLFEYKISEALSTAINSKYQKQIAELNTKFKAVYGSQAPHLVFNMKVGEVDLSPSRETIENTTKNIDTLFLYAKRAAYTIFKEIEDNYDQYFDDLFNFHSNPPTTYKDYLEAHNEFYTKYSKSLSEAIQSYFYNSDDNKISDIKIKFKSNNYLHNFPDHFQFCHSVTIKTTMHKLRFNSKGKAGTLSSNYFKLDFDNNNNLKPIYLVNDTLAKAAKYYNYHNTSTIGITNYPTFDTTTQIELDSIIGIKDPVEFAEFTKVFDGYYTLLDNTLFEIPKQVSTTQAKRSAADTTVVFKILHNSTLHQFTDTRVTAKEFYSTPLDPDTRIFILNNDEHTTGWLDFVKTTLVDYKVLLLIKTHQPELKSKRFEKFIESLINKPIISSSNFYDAVYKDNNISALAIYVYSPSFTLILKLHYAIKILNPSNGYDYSTSTYKQIVNSEFIKLIKKLMGIYDFKSVVRLIQHHKLDTLSPNFSIFNSCYLSNFLTAFLGILSKDLSIDKFNDARLDTTAINLWRRSDHDSRSWLLQNSPILATLRSDYQQLTY